MAYPFGQNLMNPIPGYAQMQRGGRNQQKRTQTYAMPNTRELGAAYWPYLQSAVGGLANILGTQQPPYSGLSASAPFPHGGSGLMNAQVAAQPSTAPSTGWTPQRAASSWADDAAIGRGQWDFLNQPPQTAPIGGAAPNQMQTEAGQQRVAELQKFRDFIDAGGMYGTPTEGGRGYAMGDPRRGQLPVSPLGAAEAQVGTNTGYDAARLAMQGYTPSTRTWQPALYAPETPLTSETAAVIGPYTRQSMGAGGIGLRKKKGTFLPEAMRSRMVLAKAQGRAAKRGHRIPTPEQIRASEWLFPSGGEAVAGGAPVAAGGAAAEGGGGVQSILRALALGGEKVLPEVGGLLKAQQARLGQQFAAEKQLAGTEATAGATRFGAEQQLAGTEAMAGATRFGAEQQLAGTEAMAGAARHGHKMTFAGMKEQGSATRFGAEKRADTERYKADKTYETDILKAKTDSEKTKAQAKWETKRNEIESKRVETEAGTELAKLKSLETIGETQARTEVGLLPGEEPGVPPSSPLAELSPQLQREIQTIMKTGNPMAMESIRQLIVLNTDWNEAKQNDFFRRLSGEPSAHIRALGGESLPSLWAPLRRTGLMETPAGMDVGADYPSFLQRRIISGIEPPPGFFSTALELGKPRRRPKK